jgi:hypothetical protein
MITELIRIQQNYFNYLNNLKNELNIDCALIPVLRDVSYRIKALSTLYANGDIDDKFFEKELQKNKTLIEYYLPKYIKYKIITDPRSMEVILLDDKGNEYKIY